MSKKDFDNLTEARNLVINYKIRKKNLNEEIDGIPIKDVLEQMEKSLTKLMEIESEEEN